MKMNISEKFHPKNNPNKDTIYNILKQAKMHCRYEKSKGYVYADTQVKIA